MAKKEKLKLGELNLDDDLNFEEFDFESLDSKMSPDSKKPKKRQPVMDVFKGTVAGVKDEIKSPSFLAKTLEAAMPKEYGEIVSTGSEMLGNASSLYDGAIREIKPQLSRIAKKVDKLVPAESKRLKKVTDKFKSLIGDETQSFSGPSKEQIQEQSIANSLAQVFAADAEANIENKAKEAAENRIKTSIESKRFTSNFGLLSSINDGVSKLNAYTTKVTQAYQRKSLELQYRSYFVQNELYQTTSKFFEIFNKQNEVIVKNTALPEFVKIKNSERFKELAKSRLMTGAQTAIGRAGERLKGKATQFVSDFKSGLEAADQGLEGIENMREMQASLADAGMQTDSGYKTAGRFAGSSLASFMGEKIGGKVRSKIKDDSPLAKLIFKTVNITRNLEGEAANLRNSKFIKDNEDGDGAKSILAKMAGGFLDLFKAEDKDQRLQTSKGLSDLNNPEVTFNNKTQKSITEVIPGYLARIYRELGVLSSGNKNLDMTVYDFASGKFVTQKQLTKDIEQTLARQIKFSMQGYNVDQAVSNLIGKKPLSGDTQKEVKQFFSRIAQDKTINVFTPEAIKASSHFAALSPQAAKLVSDSLDHEISQSPIKDKKQSKFTNDIIKIRESVVDLRSHLESIVNAGGAYSEIAEKEGYVVRDDRGNVSANESKIASLTEQHALNSSASDIGREVFSIEQKPDSNVKQKIKVIIGAKPEYKDFLVNEGVITFSKGGNKGKMDIDEDRFLDLEYKYSLLLRKLKFIIGFINKVRAISNHIPVLWRKM